jgi:hypothetical protein
MCTLLPIEYKFHNSINAHPCLESTADVSGELGGDISTCSPYFLATELCRGSLVCAGVGKG